MAGIKREMFGSIAESMQGRGALPGEISTPTRSAIERQSDGRKRLDSAAVIRLDRIIADPNQPRKDFDADELERLASSLRERGQLQPIRVRWDDAAGIYVVVVGERRWRAARIAGLETLACVVVTGSASAEDLLEDQLIENALRSDLRPIEQANAYKALMASRQLSQRQLGERLNIAPATIAKALALLTLPEPIQEQVETGALAPGTAYELSKVKDPTEQATLATAAVAGRLKRDEVQTRKRPAGKGKPRKITERVIRTTAGPRIAVEFKRGLTPELLRAALAEALALVDAEASNEERDAA